MRVYLAGPITGTSYGECVGWREGLIPYFKQFGITALSPMRGKAYLSKEDKVKDSYSDHTMSSIVGINVRDYNDVKTADAILVNFLGATRVSIGTVMEIAWARAFQIPTVIIMGKENPHEHGMLTYGAIITTDIDEGVEAIIQILGA